MIIYKREKNNNNINEQHATYMYIILWFNNLSEVIFIFIADCGRTARCL